MQVYGYGGVGIIVEVLTDKVNRSVALVREVVRDCGGKMADPGSIMFKFRRARVVNIKAKDADKDQLLAVALDAGADDVIEPPVDEEDNEEDVSERYMVAFSILFVDVLCILAKFNHFYKPKSCIKFQLFLLVNLSCIKRAELFYLN